MRFSYFVDVVLAYVVLAYGQGRHGYGHVVRVRQHGRTHVGGRRIYEWTDLPEFKTDILLLFVLQK